LEDSGKAKRLSQSVPRRPKDQELVNEEEPWDAKNVLSFGKYNDDQIPELKLTIVDGGGVRGLYSLYILQLLMRHIEVIEKTFADGKGEESQALSSFFPLDEPLNVSHNQTTSRDSEGGPSGQFLPCHYFDYICGTSTGG
jgi:hypothetical protein